MDKARLFEEGTALLGEFCEANTLTVPAIDRRSRDTWRFSSTCAYYRPVGIHICVERCAAIGKAGRAWSFPGYTVDRTPYGVLQHELGHHVDYHLSEQRGSYFGDFSIRLRASVREEKLTSYCPNDAEWFAELFRLFVTNSDLLRAVRPRTYQALRELYKPVVDRPWREVLKDAPERTLAAAANKIG